MLVVLSLSASVLLSGPLSIFFLPRGAVMRPQMSTPRFTGAQRASSSRLMLDKLYSSTLSMEPSDPVELLHHLRLWGR